MSADATPSDAILRCVSDFGAGHRVVVGSDLLGVEASEALYKFSGRAELPLVLALDGSRSGIEQLKAGHVDLALLVSAPDESAAPEGFESITLAHHCVLVLVPATVPLEQITLGQLRDVFGESGSKNLCLGGDLGIKGDLAASAIGMHVPAVGQGTAMEFFRQAVLQNRPFSATVARYATPAELILRLRASGGRWPSLPGAGRARLA